MIITQDEDNRIASLSREEFDKLDPGIRLAWIKDRTKRFPINKKSNSCYCDLDPEHSAFDAFIVYGLLGFLFIGSIILMLARCCVHL